MKQIVRRAPRIVVGMLLIAAGAAIAWFLLLSPLRDWSAMRAWTPGSAQVLEARLEQDTTTDSDGNTSTIYKAVARYQYEWEGRRYTSDRVGITDGADNVGSFQQRMASQLIAAKARNEPITIYVNPLAPHESVVSRDLRIGLMLFQSIFGLTFGPVLMLLGLVACFPALDGGMVRVLERITKSTSTAGGSSARPWLKHAAWRLPQIRTRARDRVLQSVLTALVAGGIAAFALAPWQEWPSVQSAVQALLRGEGAAVLRGQWLALASALLCIGIGSGLLIWVIWTALSYRRHGELVLHMDPHPGSIDGDVGGTVDLPLVFDRGRLVSVRLSCTHVYETGSGRDSVTKHETLWSDMRSFFCEPAANGQSRLHFRIRVPAGLPASSIGFNRHDWELVLRCELPGIDLVRSFRIPVYATAQTMRATARVREQPATGLRI